MKHLQFLANGSAAPLIEHVALQEKILQEAGGMVSRAVIAAALNLHLLAGLVERVPNGRGYVEGVVGDGRKLVFDHGALRTVALSRLDLAFDTNNAQGIFKMTAA